jgi:hypothetical protein
MKTSMVFSMGLMNPGDGRILSRYYFIKNAITYNIVKIIPFEYPCDNTGHNRLFVF